MIKDIAGDDIVAYCSSNVASSLCSRLHRCYVTTFLIMFNFCNQVKMSCERIYLLDLSDFFFFREN